MKLLYFIFLLFWVSLSHASDGVDKIHSLRADHPMFPAALVSYQDQLIREARWEQALAVGHLYRKHFIMNSKSFRAAPLLMEAYSLIQFCRYEDAQKVLSLGEFYAKKFNRKDELFKIKKGQELQQLSRLYATNPPATNSAAFKSNELEWPAPQDSELLLKHLDKIKIRTKSLCGS